LRQAEADEFYRHSGFEFQNIRTPKPRSTEIHVIFFLDFLNTRQRSWLRQCTPWLRAAGTIPDEVIGFFSIYLILPAAQAGMSANNLSGDKARPALKADNLTAIYEPIF
jgi:hypothetical protein